jgi:integrase
MKTRHTPLPTEGEQAGTLRRVASNLYRMEPYGTYYAVNKKDGKQFRQSLKTKDRKLAERRLREVMEKVERLKAGTGRLTFGEIAKQFIGSELAARDLKRQSRADCLVRIASLQRTWRGLSLTPVRDIKTKDCEQWFAGRKQQIHAQRLNNELGILKQILAFAEREGFIMSNPATPIRRVKIVAVEPTIPTRDQFTLLVATLRKMGNHDAADFVELLGYSGTRRNEGASLTWGDIDFDRGTFRVTGGAEGTKNRQTRRVPLFPNLRRFLLNLRQQRGDTIQTDARIMRIQQCRDGIHLACKLAGLPPFDHHAMRHFFASNAIEQNIDFRVIAGWLGHKDGGLLVAKVYGHLCVQHSDAMARRMTFSATAGTPANVVPIENASS